MSAVYQRRMPSLKEMCLRIFANIDVTSVSFVGVPPHLINEILQHVESPEDLRRVQDLPANQAIPGFNEAIDHRWETFVLERFWRSKAEPPVLPEGSSWRDFYDALEESLAKSVSGEGSAAKVKKKKAKELLDPSTIPRDSGQPRSTGRWFPGASKPSPSNDPRLGKLARDFLRKFG